MTPCLATIIRQSPPPLPPSPFSLPPPPRGPTDAVSSQVRKYRLLCHPLEFSSSELLPIPSHVWLDRNGTNFSSFSIHHTRTFGPSFRGGINKRAGFLPEGARVDGGGGDSRERPCLHGVQKGREGTVMFNDSVNTLNRAPQHLEHPGHVSVSLDSTPYI